MFTIDRLEALEIFDSRGRPTVEVACTLAGGAPATAQVPSGASTGKAEALELRDGDPKRHRGLGCLQAVAHVNTTIAAALRGQTFPDQAALDRALLELDGTENKSRLGANAVLGVSLAFARAAAGQRKVPFYQHLADLAGEKLRTLPRLTVNLFSGGKHAGGQVEVQDVLLVPVSARTIADALAVVCAVYQAAAELVWRKYHMRLLTADEGGLAPPFPSAQAMIEDALAAIAAAGLTPGKDVALAIDVAASHFYRHDRYHIGDELLTSARMTDRVRGWVERYPIVSVEDALAEEDWDHWPALRAALAGKALTLGDDFLCTNPRRIERAIASGACDALLLKVNQIGTLTEAAHALRLARSAVNPGGWNRRAAGWRVTISARSGETEDHWLADLSVGWAGDQIKVGSVTQSERLAKYNRLLAIEKATKLPIVDWP